MRWRRLSPTASTAPRGASRDGVCGPTSWTLNSLMLVPFHTPAVPFETSISLAKMKLHSRDSYHPRDSGDHSNRCTRIADGSMPWTSVLLMVSKAAVVLDDESVGITGPSCEISVRMVCRGSSGTQLSSYQQRQYTPGVGSVMDAYPFSCGSEVAVGHDGRRNQTTQAACAVLPGKGRRANGHLASCFFRHSSQLERNGVISRRADGCGS